MSVLDCVPVGEVIKLRVGIIPNDPG
jgi:hypothetical protein